MAVEERPSREKLMWKYPEALGLNPSERWGHSSCYYNGLVYVFGGCRGGVHFGDVLVLDQNKMVWRCLITTGNGPCPRDSHTAVIAENKMVVFGGTNGRKKLNDLYMLDLDSYEWVRPSCSDSPPSARESHTATVFGGARMVVFGGSGEGESNYLNDLHVLDLRRMRWVSPSVTGHIPAPRDSHTAVAIEHRLIVYGGDCGNRHLGDVDIFDLDTLTWSKLEIASAISPGIRAGHATVTRGPTMYVIGGVSDEHYYSDVWVLDLPSSSWTQLVVEGTRPQGRFSHTAILANTEITIYGGCGENECPLKELLVLQLRPSLPTPQRQHRNESLRRKRARESMACHGDSANHSATSHTDHAPNNTPNILDSSRIGMEDDIRCKIDGVFDYGYLTSAVVNGKLFRGVLFDTGAPIDCPISRSYWNLKKPIPKCKKSSAPFSSAKCNYNSSNTVDRSPLGTNTSFPELPNIGNDLAGTFLTLGNIANRDDVDLT